MNSPASDYLSMTYTVAFIGTGPDPENPIWGTSAAMAYSHADAYQQNESCVLVACADLIRDHGEAFAERFDIPREHVFEEYTEMLNTVAPDIVSICTPVPTHADIVVDVAKHDAVSAIHCEKPMADTWGDSQRMAAVAESEGVQLTFNHQRRFAPATKTAADLLTDGEIGDIVRFEVGGKNLFDFGSHLIDLCTHFHSTGDPEWVLCQVDYRTENIRYGTHNENQAIAHWHYDDGVDAILASGDDGSLVDCLIRIVGTEGSLDLWPQGDGDAPALRFNGGGETAPVEGGEEMMLCDAIDHFVDCLDTGETPIIAASETLKATKIIFGCWESARKRSRIDFPLDIEDNPLEAMIENGALTPVASNE
jgi:UDP-N-acetylglucosamine 3-dehydrogenase